MKKKDQRQESPERGCDPSMGVSSGLRIVVSRSSDR